MTTDTHEAYAHRAHIAEALQEYAFGCDTKDWEGLLAVFTDDARAMYDGENWLDGGAIIVEFLHAALDGLSYSQHMITTPRISVDGDNAAAVGYLNAHQCAAEDPRSLIRMNARYDAELRLVGKLWRISKLVLTVGWFDSSGS